MFPLFAKQHSQAHDMWWAASEILLGRYLNTCCFLGFVLLLAHNLVCFFKTFKFLAYMRAELLQLCPTLCYPMD